MLRFVQHINILRRDELVIAKSAMPKKEKSNSTFHLFMFPFTKSKHLDDLDLASERARYLYSKKLTVSSYLTTEPYEAVKMS